MGYKRSKFNEKGFNEKEYTRYFRLNQAEYIRKKLRCLKAYSDGLEFEEISTKFNIHTQSVRSYINCYIAGGFELLCQETLRPKTCLLTESQSLEFKNVLLKSPKEFGIDSNIWTGVIMCQYLKKTYGVEYKSGIYDLLERLGLSHQKAHADYGNADIEQQRVFIKDFKDTILGSDSKTAIVKFDEFSICEKPSSYYGWAEKNTRPRYVTNEKKENA
jgi:transposase